MLDNVILVPHCFDVLESFQREAHRSDKLTSDLKEVSL